MSITAAKVLKVARHEIGTRETGNNHTKYGKAWGLDGYAWCGQFVAWVFAQAGADLRKEGITGAASTNLFDLQARRKGWQRISKYTAKPGDVVFYSFGDLGPGDTANDDDHVGILSRRSNGLTLKAIEGNTGSGAGGSQANADRVYERTRSLGLVRHVYRPPYKALSAHAVARQKAAAAALAKTRAAQEAARAAARHAAQARAAAAKKALESKRAAAAKKAAAAAAAALLAGGGAVATQVIDNPAPHPTPAVTATPTHSPYAPPTTHLPPPPSKPPAPVLTRTLRVTRPAMHGQDVVRVRQLLGVRPGTLYTVKVAVAVKRWQRAHGVYADGDFGPASASAAHWIYRPKGSR